MSTQLQKRFYPTIGQSFFIPIKILLASLIVSIPFIATLIIFPGMFTSGNFYSLLLLILYVSTFALVVFIEMRKIGKNNDVKHFRFSAVPVSTILLALITVLTAGLVIEPFVESLPVPETFQNAFQRIIQPNIFSFMLVALVPAIFEELLFRGIILEGFLKNYSPQKAILWSAMIFGVVHFNLSQGITAVVFGIIIGWVYCKTNSLIPGMIIHFINNSIAFALSMSAHNVGSSFFSLFKNEIFYWIALVIAVYICGACLIILNRRFSSNSSEESQIQFTKEPGNEFRTENTLGFNS
ncbi:MAG TPA: type II CAAX endopeptidase family protein [Chitinophagales bacterium]|nr:type II CAAX endopeptidase family protein [Chitinophagales bacterium]